MELSECLGPHGTLLNSIGCVESVLNSLEVVLVSYCRYTMVYAFIQVRSRPCHTSGWSQAKAYRAAVSSEHALLLCSACPYVVQAWFDIRCTPGHDTGW